MVPGMFGAGHRVTAGARTGAGETPRYDLDGTWFRMEADQLPHVALPIEDKGTDGGKGRPSAAHLHGHHPLRLQHGQRPSFSRHLSDLSLRSIPSSLRTERGMNEMSDVLDRLRRLAEEDRREFSKLQVGRGSTGGGHD